MVESLLEVAFRHRSTLVLAPALPVVLWGFGARGGAGPAALASGALLVVCGGWVRLAAVRRIGRGARVYRAHARGGLVRSGPFRWSRNPLYVATGLILAGFGLMAGGGLWALGLLPATLLVYTPAVLAEEKALEKLLGSEYLRYRETTPRWFGPVPRSARDGAAPLVPWREVMRREKWLVPGLAFGILAFFFVAPGLPRVDAVWVGAGWLAFAIWNSVHVERKRRRRLRSAERYWRGAPHPPRPVGAGSSGERAADEDHPSAAKSSFAAG